MSNIFANIDRMSTGAKLFFVAIGVLLMLAYSLENQPPKQQPVPALISAPAPVSAPAPSPEPPAQPQPAVGGTTKEPRQIARSVAVSNAHESVQPAAPAASAVTSFPKPLPTSPPPARSSSVVTGLPALNSQPLGLSSSGESRPLPENAAQPHVQDFQNLTRCQNGHYPCNRQLLSPEQLADVDVREKGRNLTRCQNGHYPCNRQLLSPEQLADVDVREKGRNLMRCLNGHYPCNRQLLTPEQVTQVQQRASQRGR